MLSDEKHRYEYKLTLGKDINGHLLRKSFYSTRSRADARKKAEKFKANYELELLCGGEEIRPKVLFEDWAIKCLELYKKPYVKANSYSGTYLSPVKLHLIPYFGKMPVDAILPAKVQQYINEAAKKYSPETVKKDFAVLSFIMQAAVDNGLCKSSPVTKTIRLPKYKTVTKKEAFSQLEYDTTFAFAAQHPLGLDIMFLLETGVSRSELLGLRWEDLDLENGTVTISQGLVSFYDDEQEQWTTSADGLKNKYRHRTIPIVNADLLERLKAKPREIIPAGRKKPVQTEYVFHGPSGGPYQPNNWANRVYRPFMRDLLAAHPELPELSPHELRHTRATLWVAQGVDPLMVIRLLGHCDMKMLTKIYDHTTVETLRKALETQPEQIKEDGRTS